VKQISLKQGVGKTRNKQILNPKPGKSSIIPAGQKTTLKKGGLSTGFQDVRDLSQERSKFARGG